MTTSNFTPAQQTFEDWSNGQPDRDFADGFDAKWCEQRAENAWHARDAEVDALKQQLNGPPSRDEMQGKIAALENEIETHGAETAAILEKAAETSWRPGDAPLTAERVESIKRIRALIPTPYAAALAERERKARLEEAEWSLKNNDEDRQVRRVLELRAAALPSSGQAERGKE